MLSPHSANVLRYFPHQRLSTLENIKIVSYISLFCGIKFKYRWKLPNSRFKTLYSQTQAHANPFQPTLQVSSVLSRVYLQVMSYLYYLEKTMVLKKFSCLTSTLCYLCFLPLLLWFFVTMLGRVCPLRLHNDTMTGLLAELLWELSGKMSRGRNCPHRLLFLTCTLSTCRRELGGKQNSQQHILCKQGGGSPGVSKALSGHGQTILIMEKRRFFHSLPGIQLRFLEQHSMWCIVTLTANGCVLCILVFYGIF